MPDLERSYRRLLWAYPRSYRRRRGLEILTTMLDAAKPGQQRPTRAEFVHLLLSGLKCRLVPSGWAGKIAAGVVTLWVALVLSGAGAYVVWEPQWIAPPEASTLDEAITGGQRPASVWTKGADPLDLGNNYKGWAELQTFGDEGWTGQRPAPMGYTRIYERPGSAEQALADVYQRLRAKGWQTGPVVQLDACTCEVFWASRDGVMLRVAGGRWIVVGVHRAEPDGVFTGAIAGFAVGLVLAWPVMTWLAHRFARARGADRILALLLGVAVLWAAAANTVDSVLSMVPDPDTASVLLAADLMYPLANQAADPLAAIVIVLGLAAIVAVTGITQLQRRHPVERSG